MFINVYAHIHIIHYFGRNATFILKQSVRSMEWRREQIQPRRLLYFSDHSLAGWWPLCRRNLLGIIDVEQWNMDFPGGGFRFKLGGGFKYFVFSPLFGEDSHFDAYFSKGLVQPPTSKDFGEICLSPLERPREHH